MRWTRADPMPSTRIGRAQPIPTGVGIGLRPAHVEQVLEQHPAVPFFELHSENLFCAGGPMWDVFERVRRDYPVSLHGVGLSLGSADALDPAHLRRLREVIARAAPALVSEHVCWGAIGGRHFNNVYVNSINHGIDAVRYLDSIDPAAVGEIHLAGFSRQEGLGGPLLIDSH